MLWKWKFCIYAVMLNCINSRFFRLRIIDGKLPIMLWTWMRLLNTLYSHFQSFSRPESQNSSIFTEPCKQFNINWVLQMWNSRKVNSTIVLMELYLHSSLSSWGHAHQTIAVDIFHAFMIYIQEQKRQKMPVKRKRRKRRRIQEVNAHTGNVMGVWCLYSLYPVLWQTAIIKFTSLSLNKFN